jgi:hypothetical protein
MFKNEKLILRLILARRSEVSRRRFGPWSIVTSISKLAIFEVNAGSQNSAVRHKQHVEAPNYGHETGEARRHFPTKIPPPSYPLKRRH